MEWRSEPRRWHGSNCPLRAAPCATLPEGDATPQCEQEHQAESSPPRLTQTVARAATRVERAATAAKAKKELEEVRRERARKAAEVGEKRAAAAASTRAAEETEDGTLTAPMPAKRPMSDRIEDWSDMEGVEREGDAPEPGAAGDSAPTTMRQEKGKQTTQRRNLH